MRPLSFDVARFARRQGLRTGVEAAGIIRVARKVLQEVLPTTLQDSVSVTSYKTGVLTCHVESGAASALVQSYRQPILQALKKELGTSRVERLLIKIGSKET